MCVKSVYDSVWVIVDAVNNCPELDIKFPDHREQEEIAKEFQRKSGADFDICIGCLDILIIWTNKPTKKYCDKTKVGKKTIIVTG